ncbi:hypothetical protein AB0F15_41955 [Amycolatopsis sp. NPDC026612]
MRERTADRRDHPDGIGRGTRIWQAPPVTRREFAGKFADAATGR